MTLTVHLVSGEDAEARAVRIAALADGGRAVVLVAAPVEWLMGPGCICCVDDGHPRRRLLALEAEGVRRVLVDGGPPDWAARVAASLRALPVPLRVAVRKA